MAGYVEHGNEPSDSIKGQEFLDMFRNYQLLKEDSATWIWLVSLLAVYFETTFKEKQNQEIPDLIPKHPVR
jgi:hypothetical protein